MNKTFEERRQTKKDILKMFSLKTKGEPIGGHKTTTASGRILESRPTVNNFVFRVSNFAVKR